MAVESLRVQKLILDVLISLPIDRMNEVKNKWYKQCEEHKFPEDISHYMSSCFSCAADYRVSSEKNIRKKSRGKSLPDNHNSAKACYDNLEAVCRAIIARQEERGEKPITDKEVKEMLGIKHDQQKARLNQGTLKNYSPETLLSRCNKFDKGTRIFWQNELFLFLPHVRFSPNDSKFSGITVAEKSLLLLWMLLDDKTRDNACQKDVFAAVFSANKLKLPSQSKEFERREEDSLYEYLEAVRPKKAITIKRLCDDVLGKDKKTWEAWQTGWNNAVRENFEHGVPNRRISCRGLYLIALEFGLSYNQTLYLLSLAGSFLHPGELDDRVLCCLPQNFDRENEDILRFSFREKPDLAQLKIDLYQKM